MQQSRETVMNALFTLLQGATTFNTVGRKFLPPDQVGPDMRPAMFLVERTEDEKLQEFGMPTIGTIDVMVVIYVNTLELAVPISAVNAVIDGIDLALQPSPMTGRQTLGNLVANVWKEGKTIKIPGDTDGDGMAFVPLKIMVP